VTEWLLKNHFGLWDEASNVSLIVLAAIDPRILLDLDTLKFILSESHQAENSLAMPREQLLYWIAKVSALERVKNQCPPLSL
jgi:hypothetical protein